MEKQIEDILKKHTKTVNSFLDDKGINHWNDTIKDLSALLTSEVERKTTQIYSFDSKSTHFNVKRIKHFLLHLFIPKESHKLYLLPDDDSMTDREIKKSNLYCWGNENHFNGAVERLSAIIRSEIERIIGKDEPTTVSTNGHYDYKLSREAIIRNLHRAEQRKALSDIKEEGMKADRNYKSAHYANWRVVVGR